jgi:hypothetical protein
MRWVRGCVVLTCTLLSQDCVAVPGVQAHTIIAGGDYLRRVAKAKTTILKAAFDFGADARYNHNLGALPHPYRRLVGSLESMDSCRGVIIRGHGDVVLVRLRHPARHSERRRCGWYLSTYSVPAQQAQERLEPFLLNHLGCPHRFR